MDSKKLEAPGLGQVVEGPFSPGRGSVAGLASGWETALDMPLRNDGLVAGPTVRWARGVKHGGKGVAVVANRARD